MDNNVKEEMSKRRVEGLHLIIDTAARLNHLLQNDDFNFFISKIKGKQRQYDNILHNPKQIGFVTRKTVNLTGNVQYMDFKYTAEDDQARMKEAQIRYDTLQRIIDLVQDFNEEARRAVQELAKLTTNNIPKK